MQPSAGELYFFPPGEKKYKTSRLPLTRSLAKRPKSLYLSCNLLYKLAVLLGRNVLLRESDREREGRSGAKWEEAEKINYIIPCQLAQLGEWSTWMPDRVGPSPCAAVPASFPSAWKGAR